MKPDRDSRGSTPRQALLDVQQQFRAVWATRPTERLQMTTAVVFQGPPAAASLAQSIILAQLIVLRRLEAVRAAMWTAPVAGVSLFLPSLLLVSA